MRRALLPALLVLAALAACSDDDPAAPGDGRAPDFRAVDVNPTSATYGETVTPRDHLGTVTAWYFGVAT